MLVAANTAQNAQIAQNEKEHLAMDMTEAEVYAFNIEKVQLLGDFQLEQLKKSIELSLVTHIAPLIKEHLVGHLKEIEEIHKTKYSTLLELVDERIKFRLTHLY
jgi:hypothetical protein